MATTGTPNQKYVATDKPDLVSGKYSSHTHSFSLADKHGIGFSSGAVLVNRGDGTTHTLAKKTSN